MSTFYITRVDKVTHCETFSREEIIELLRGLQDDTINARLDSGLNDDALLVELLAAADDLDSDYTLSDIVTNQGDSLGEVEEWNWEMTVEADL